MNIQHGSASQQGLIQNVHGVTFPLASIAQQPTTVATAEGSAGVVVSPTANPASTVPLTPAATQLGSC